MQVPFRSWKTTGHLEVSFSPDWAILLVFIAEELNPSNIIGVPPLDSSNRSTSFLCWGPQSTPCGVTQEWRGGAESSSSTWWLCCFWCSPGCRHNFPVVFGDFHVFLVACAACICVKAPHLGFWFCCFPTGTRLNSFEVFSWCFSAGFCYLRSPWLISVRVQMSSGVVNTFHSQWQRVVTSTCPSNLPDHPTICVGQAPWEWLLSRWGWHGPCWLHPCESELPLRHNSTTSSLDAVAGKAPSALVLRSCWPGKATCLPHPQLQGTSSLKHVPYYTHIHMSVYIYVCVCMYTHIYTYIYMYIYICMMYFFKR